MDTKPRAEAEGTGQKCAGTDAAIEKAVLEELSRSCSSLSARRLAQKTAVLAQVPQYRVMTVLRSMLEQGKLTLKHGKIRSLRMAPQYSRERLKEETKGTRDWDFFRKLLPYYIHCLRADDGIKCEAWQDELGKNFTFLGRRGQWYPQLDSPWSLSLSFSESAEQISSLWSSGRDDLVLGYPVYACIRRQDGKDLIHLMPVFLHQLHHEIFSGSIELSLMNAEPSVNHAWVDACVSPKSRKQRFFRAIGIDTLPDETTGSSASAPHDFATLARILSLFLPDLIREPLDPTLVLGTPFSTPLESGIYNKAVIVSAQNTKYTTGLIKELEEIAHAPDNVLEQTALKYFFLDAKNEAEPMHEGAVADTTTLSSEQRRAVASLLSMPLTVVQGPPGTGKSQVAAAACANARLCGQSVLVSSYNHKALDALMSKLACDDGDNLAVRCNSRDNNEARFSYADAIGNMLAERATDEDEIRFRSLRRELQAWLLERSRMIDRAKDMAAWSHRLGALEEQIGRVEHLLPTGYADKARKLPSLNKSWIACFGMAQLFVDELKKSGTTFFQLFLKKPLIALRTRRLVRSCRDDLQIHVPRWFAREDPAILESIRLRLLWAGTLFEALGEQRELREKIEKMGWSFDELVTKLDGLTKHVEDQVKPLLVFDRRRRKGIGGERLLLANLERLLKQSSSRRNLGAGLEAAKVAKEILHHTPVWAVTSLSVGQYIPLAPGIFDLVLVDEASQSNIASAIPLLFRARRAGIVGDPKQLAFITNLTRDDDALLMRRFHPALLTDLRLSFSLSSLYDLAYAVPSANPYMLDETWRSAPEIARYSSELFYGGKLAVATNELALRRALGLTPGMHWREVAGMIIRDPKHGTYCSEEVEETLKVVVELVKDENFDGTVGVVTPFREQKERIMERLQECPDIPREAWEKMELDVGTAHGFQGDERDVMIFSLCAGPDIARGALNFLRNQANLFNVAVSRARALLVVVGNREYALSCGIPHVRALADRESTRGRKQQKSPWHPHESPWEKRLHDALLERGIKTIPKYHVRGRRLDLALTDPENPHLKLDIEVDGDGHFTDQGTVKSDDHWRDLTLRNYGWAVLRFWTFELAENMNKCIDRVKQARDKKLDTTKG